MPGSGQQNTPDLSGAMNATRNLVEAMDVASRSYETYDASGGEGPSDLVRRTIDTPTPPPPYSQMENSSTVQPVERFIRADGKIGVVIAQGHNGRTSKVRLLFDPRDPASQGKTRRMEEIALFDTDVVAAVLEGHAEQAKVILLAKMRLPNQYYFSNLDLKVMWLAPGDEFEVAKAFESESIRYKKLVHWWRA